MGSYLFGTHPEGNKLGKSSSAANWSEKKLIDFHWLDGNSHQLLLQTFDLCLRVKCFYAHIFTAFIFCFLSEELDGP